MATRTKEEYEQLGYRHASNGDVRSYKSDSTSWQGLAYNAGVQRYNAEAAERGFKGGPGRDETLLAVELHKQPAWEVKPGDKVSLYGDGGKLLEFPVVSFAGRGMGKSRMAEMMREAGFQPPPPQPAKPIKIWFDELQHNTPANRWSTEPGFEGWPVGAVAHVKNLVEQLKTETDIKREVRLLNALTRLKRRHGVRA